MQLLKQLFTTEVGLFSAVGIGFMLCMLVFFVWLFTRTAAPPADQKQPCLRRPLRVGDRAFVDNTAHA